MQDDVCMKFYNFPANYLRELPEVTSAPICVPKTNRSLLTNRLCLKGARSFGNYPLQDIQIRTICVFHGKEMNVGRFFLLNFNQQQQQFLAIIDRLIGIFAIVRIISDKARSPIIFRSLLTALNSLNMVAHIKVIVGMLKTL